MSNILDYTEGTEKPKPLRPEHEAKILGIIQSNIYASVNDLQSWYLQDWDRHERSYRRIWDGADSTRKSERDQYVSNLTQAAIDERIAEITDATFGYGRWFDLVNTPTSKANFDTEEQAGGGDFNVERISNVLFEQLQSQGVSDEIEQVAALGEIFGTGIAELVIQEYTEYTPEQRQRPDGSIEHGTTQVRKKRVVPVAINPRNFRIPPGSTDIDSAPWVAVESFVPTTYITDGVKSGMFLDPGSIPDYPQRFEQLLESDQKKWPQRSGQVLLCRWFGKMEKGHLDGSKSKDMVEAVVYVLNRSVVIRAIANPYMCQDRPFVVYRPKRMVGRFHGIGTAQDLHKDQVAADGHYRTHSDALAYTAYPVMGTDATRVPKGLKLDIHPGKNVLFNGRPSEIIERLPFGQPDVTSLNTSQTIIGWSKDTAGVATAGNQPPMGSPESGSLMIALSPILKRTKLAIRAFSIQFLQPYIMKTAYRLMQFNPEAFPAMDYTFRSLGTMSMGEREFESSKLSRVMATLGPTSPVTAILGAEMVALSPLRNRAQVGKQLKDIAAEQQKQQAEDHSGVMLKEISLRKMAAEAGKLEAEAVRQVAEAKLAMAEAEHVEDRIRADIFKAMVTNSDSATPDDIEFERRARAAEIVIQGRHVDEKARDREVNQRIAMAQMKAKMGIAPSNDDSNPDDEILKGILSSIMGKDSTNTTGTQE
jgi:hypothetical protein